MIVRPLRVAALPTPIDDSGLVVRIQSDDETAFAELYQRHAGYVARVVYRLMGDDADVDDIVQDTFVDAADGIANVHEPGSIRRWLVVIAVRRVRRTLVRRRRRRWFGGQIADMSPRASNPEDRRLVDELYDALDRIPDEVRIPWVLARVEQQPLQDVADACAVSLATVKRRIAEADERLERKLKDD
jgi:RNA polymerase sigma-70 factor (ECF subfamily)